MLIHIIADIKDNYILETVFFAGRSIGLWSCVRFSATNSLLRGVVDCIDIHRYHDRSRRRQQCTMTDAVFVSQLGELSHAADTHVTVSAMARESCAQLSLSSWQRTTKH